MISNCSHVPPELSIARTVVSGPIKLAASLFSLFVAQGFLPALTLLGCLLLLAFNTWLFEESPSADLRQNSILLNLLVESLQCSLEWFVLVYYYLSHIPPLLSVGICGNARHSAIDAANAGLIQQIPYYTPEFWTVKSIPDESVDLLVFASAVCVAISAVCAILRSLRRGKLSSR
jgi:hypothetical protein